MSSIYGDSIFSINEYDMSPELRAKLRSKLKFNEPESFGAFPGDEDLYKNYINSKMKNNKENENKHDDKEDN